MSINQDYIELICKVKPNLQKHIDVLTAFLSESGFESFMETESGINAYISQKDFNPEIINALTKKFTEFKSNYQYKIIKDQNWNETWTENYFEPIVFRKDLVVRASFHKQYPEAGKEIIIDPKTAFGTGYHATTYMLIEEILQLDTSNKSVLDMGTGTGILAILSKMKGSSFTFAVDNDPKAVINTNENIIINNTADIKVSEGDIKILNNEKFDIIFENIWKNIVINDIPILAKHLNKDGILLTSGFYYKEYHEVKQAAENIGLYFDTVREKDDWAMVKFIKK